MTISQTMPWAVVTVRMPQAQPTRDAWAETLDRLDEVGALIAATDAVGGVELRDPRTIDGPQRPELVVYTTPEALGEVADHVRAVLRAFDLDAEIDAQVRTDDDWRDTWKQFYKPMVLGCSALLLRPSWIPRQPGDPVREIVLDPGRAFGTGLHETTQLCIDRICALWSAGAKPARVLDLGCGSGILALCAARLFESAALVAIDDDPEATATTIENAQINDHSSTLAARLDVRTGDVERAAKGGPYNLVLANIRAHTLAPRAAAIFEHTAPGGNVVLSGVLVDELAEVEAAFLAAGFVRDRSVHPWPRQRDIWVAVDLERPQ